MSSQAIALTAETRTVTGKKVKALRRSGMVPAVVYERGQASADIQISYQPLVKVWNQAGKHHVITLTLGKKEMPTLIQHITLDPVKGSIAHVAFHAIKMNEKVETEVPVNLIGNSPAAQKGLIVHQNNETVVVKGLPSDIPDFLELDISNVIEADDDIRASVLVMPKNIELITEPDTMLVSVIVPRAEVEKEEDDTTAEAADAVPSEHGSDKSEEAK